MLGVGKGLGCLDYSSLASEATPTLHRVTAATQRIEHVTPEESGFGGRHP